MNEDGTVDFDRLPDRVPVYGPAGEVIGYVDPREEMLRSRPIVTVPDFDSMTEAEREEFLRTHPMRDGLGNPASGTLTFDVTD